MSSNPAEITEFVVATVMRDGGDPYFHVMKGTNVFDGPVESRERAEAICRVRNGTGSDEDVKITERWDHQVSDWDTDWKADE